MKATILILALWAVADQTAKHFQEATPASNKTIVPIDKPSADKPWASCSEMKPIEKANDGSLGSVCVDEDGRRYEIIYRSLHKACEPELNIKDKRDDYQHFMCEEKWELMIRPEKKHE